LFRQSVSFATFFKEPIADIHILPVMVMISVVGTRLQKTGVPANEGRAAAYMAASARIYAAAFVNAWTGSRLEMHSGPMEIAPAGRRSEMPPVMAIGRRPLGCG
jgi:hypothetical protein